MTDGLEISEVRLSEIIENKDGRIDSQFWTATITENSRYVYKKIGDILKQSQYGISIEMNEDGNGYPIYRMNEIHNSVCDLEVKKYANITPQEFEIFKLNYGDVLFNRTNSYEWVGRTGIYYKASEHDDKVFASYLVRLIPDTEYILPEYLTAFLNTEIAKHQIKARARQSVNQTNVNPEEVKEIAIPLLCKELQIAIQKNYHSAYADLIAAKKAYSQAESILNEYLHIRDYDDNGYAVKTLSDSFMQSGRLDAEYYQPKYEQYEKTVIHGKYGYALIKNKFACITDKCERNLSRHAYIEIGDINVDSGSYTYTVLNTEDLPDNAKIMTRAGDILVSTVRPNRGAVAILEEDNLLVSGAFTVLRPKSDYSKELLQVLLRTPVYRDWLLKFNVGTSYPVIKDNDILNMPIPLLERDKQKEISDKVQESFRLRKEAKWLLDNAIKAVETAIETDEETALRLLTIENKKYELFNYIAFKQL